MARKDTILQSFLEHEIIQNQYDIPKDKIPNTVREAKESDFPIIKAIALIVDSLESSSPPTDKGLQNLITQYLNSSIS